MPKEIRLITAALPYTNNVPHLGHIAGSHLPADIFARFSRAMGHNTLFIGGTDEHGTTSEIAAQKYNIHPKELCDFFYKIHNEIYKWFEISYDNFSRTSRPIHYKTTIEIAARIKKNGFIIEQKIKTPFCKACNRELADRYIEGKCPNCSYEKAKGDQCEQCGELLEPTRLIAPCCVVCKSKNILFEDKSHLFLELKKLSKKIETWLKNNKQIRTQVKSIAFSWINKGLKPRCITRSLNWGIPVPFRGYEHLKFYVWLDAPIGYISATKEHTKKWKLYWQNPKARIYHFLGKDNIPFHTIFWPGILIADGTYNLPYNVIGLQYLNYEGRKFSKSNNWGVFCENLPDAGLPAEYWRFYLAFLIPEAKDMEFFWKEFQERVNTELVGNFSNFIHRTLVFIEKNYNSIIPYFPQSELKKQDREFIKAIQKKAEETIALLNTAELRQGIESILSLTALANKYLQKNQPWKDKERGRVVLNLCANICGMLSFLIEPYLPSTAQKLRGMLNIKEEHLLPGIKNFKFKQEHKFNKPLQLFTPLTNEQVINLKEKTSKVTEYFKESQAGQEKIEKSKEQTGGEKMKSKDTAINATADITANEAETGLLELCTGCHYIPFEVWKKMDLRIGKIIKIEPHPNAEKLYVMLVELGPGENKRQIVAGLKNFYKMEELLNKKIVLFTNLQPALIRGIESNGMLLAAEFKGKITLIVPEDKDFQEGAKVV